MPARVVVNWNKVLARLCLSSPFSQGVLGKLNQSVPVSLIVKLEATYHMETREGLRFAGN